MEGLNIDDADYHQIHKTTLQLLDENYPDCGQVESYLEWKPVPIKAVVEELVNRHPILCEQRETDSYDYAIEFIYKLWKSKRALLKDADTKDMDSEGSREDTAFPSLRGWHDVVGINVARDNHSQVI